MDRATALGASDTNRLAYLLEVGNTTLLIGESGKEIFEQHIYRFCCKSQVLLCIRKVLTFFSPFITTQKNCVTKYTIDKAFNHSISLSSEQLVKVEEQTKQAQDILADIFEDEETVSTSRDYNDIMSVLSVLLSKESWQRSEVESICQKHHLMIGSVLERINDYSYNKIEDAVIEDDGDTIYVMTEFKDKLI